MANEPSTVTMNVSLPQPLKRYVDGKVSSGVYGSASEFVREVIRERFKQDQERQEAKQALAAKLLQGLDSGEPAPYAPGHFRARKAALVKRLGRGAKQS
jgi:antitoxin ParD1/3/4